MIDIIKAHQEYYSNLYRHRELIWILAKRDLVARYKGSVLGFLWTFLNPLLLMLTYTLVFRSISRFDIPNYPLFVLQGILIWQTFAACVNEGASSLIAAGGLVTKTPLPPEVIPAKVVISQGLNLIFAFLVYLVFAFFVFKRFSVSLVTVPLVFISVILFCAYVASVLSVVSALFKDVQQLVGNILTILFFATPVVYSFETMPDKVKKLLLLNPLTHIFRFTTDVIFWGKMPQGSALLVFLVSLVFVQLSAVFFTSWYRRRLVENI